MRTVQVVVPALILVFGLAVCSELSYAKVEYTKKEKKACVYCHVVANSKDLNGAGKYYAGNGHSLQGYESKKAPEKKK